MARMLNGGSGTDGADRAFQPCVEMMLFRLMELVLEQLPHRPTPSPFGGRPAQPCRRNRPGGLATRIEAADLAGDADVPAFRPARSSRRHRLEDGAKWWWGDEDLPK